MRSEQAASISSVPCRITSEPDSAPTSFGPAELPAAKFIGAPVSFTWRSPSFN
jgi:hypothetical protein